MPGDAARLSNALADRYRIERELGQGGMATVYLAEDLKHDRKVAIKVLKPELAAVLGAERFVTEIKTTAALQHPNILPLFDSGEAGGFLFYVMPYVEGETLRAKLDRETQLGVEESVQLVREVADALQYAHEHGVVHRDIKPENILLHAGRPMVADFGIALAVSAAAGGRMTETGLSLGTPHYMSPEQATAEKNITARSDVYSLASVLYEMLAGQPPHLGGSAQQIIMKIVTEQAPPVTQMRKSVPANVVAATARALEKVPADRFESAKAFADALTDPHFSGTAAAGAAMSGASGRSPGWQRRALVLVSTVAVVATAAAVVLALRRPTSPPGALVVSSLQPPTGGDFSERESFGALSPDGRTFAFVAIAVNGERNLWLRRLDTLAAQMVPGTAGAEAPFWSPDGRSVGYFARDALMRVDVAGGAPRTLCPATPEESGAWSGTGVIVFNTGRGLERVNAAGGPCTIAIPLDSGADAYRHPSFLPGGTRVLFERQGGTQQTVMVGDLTSGHITALVQGAGTPTWVPPGYVVYGRFNAEGSSALYAQRVRADGSATEGEATTLTGPVRTSNLVFAYAASERALLYLPGLGDREKLVVDRAGAVVDTVRVDNTFTHRYAHNHPWVALGGARAMWLYDLKQGLATPLVPRDPGSSVLRAFPVWAPSDSAVAFGWCRLSLVRVADGSVRRIAPQSTECRRATDWSSDGRYLVVTEIPSADTKSRQDSAAAPQDRTSVAALDLTSGRTIRFNVPGNASEGALSPNVHWLAYTSDETGKPEVYVQPFPAGGRPVRVSRQGGRAPRWRSDGRELFFEAPDGGILVASVMPGPGFQASAPKLLFHAPGWTRSLFFDTGTPYDVSPDGQRFIIRQTASTKDAALVQNWAAKFNAKGGS